MKIRMAVAVLVVTASACSGMKGATPALQPLGREGEVHVYALSLPRDADRLSFTIAGIAMLRQGGGEVPLQLLERELAGAGWAQRPLASGRLAPGDYVGVSVHVGAASITRDGESARLLVDPEPTRASLAFRVEAGEAVVVWLRLGQGSLRGDFAFAPGFTATLPPQTPPQVALYCTNTGSASVTAVDRRARLVTGVVPVGAEPRGIALDRAGRRAYVALSREDQLEVIDLAAGAPVGRIRLSPGDGPGDVALAADGTLVVVNVRSRSVSFVDPLAMSEVARVPVGDAPSALLVDRVGAARLRREPRRGHRDGGRRGEPRGGRDRRDRPRAALDAAEPGRQPALRRAPRLGGPRRSSTSRHSPPSRAPTSVSARPR